MSHPIVNDSSGQSPFTLKIMVTKLPSNWSNPILDRYDDSTDPDEHIDGYVS